MRAWIDLPGVDVPPYYLHRLNRFGVAMSTGLAFVGKDGIVLASDSLTSSQGQETDTSWLVQKVFPLGKNCGLVCTGLHGVGERIAQSLEGDTTECSTLEEYLGGFRDKAYQAIHDQVPVVAGVDVWLAKWSAEGNKSHEVESAIKSIQRIYTASFYTSFLLAGIDKKGQFQIYKAESAWRPHQPRRIAEKWALAGIKHVAEYWIKRLGMGLSWDQTNFSTRDLERIAMFLVKETATVATTVDLPLQLAQISREHGFQWKIPPPPAKPNFYHEELVSQCEQLVAPLCAALTPPNPDT